MSKIPVAFATTWKTTKAVVVVGYCLYGIAQWFDFVEENSVDIHNWIENWKSDR